MPARAADAECPDRPVNADATMPESQDTTQIDSRSHSTWSTTPDQLGREPSDVVNHPGRARRSHPEAAPS
jgi:hypothetical protein